MSNDGDPRWELLPHDPAAFFGLDGQYERKELKRRYSELIRRYKPEKHPAEFQRIRAAYEALDAMLRYGQQNQGGRLGPRYSWSTDESEAAAAMARGESNFAAEPSPSPVERQRPKPAVPLHMRLASEEPHQLYQDLQRRPTKTAYEYYALAVLSDVVKPDEPLGFLRWILAGLKAFPHEPALSGLLYELLRGGEFGDAAAKVLLAVSQVVPSDQFYYFTEPLWDRLLRQIPWPKFQSLLEACEVKLRDHRIAAKVTFYVHILRAAMWHATDEWLEKAMSFLAEHHDQIAGVLENEYELTLQIDRYRRTAHQFVDGSPQRASIDRCIRDFCTLDAQEAAEQFVRVQTELASDAQALLDALPFDQADYSSAYGALRWIAYEVNGRLGIQWPQPDHDALWNDAVQLMRTVDGSENPYPWQFHDFYKGIVEIVALLFLTVLSMAAAAFTTGFVFEFLFGLPTRIAGPIVVVSTIACPIGTMIFCFVYLRKRTTTRWFARRRVRLGVRRYQQAWRGQMLRFVQHTQYPLEDIHAAIVAAVQANPGMFQASTWLPGFLPQDFGLAFYALAHSYVR